MAKAGVTEVERILPSQAALLLGCSAGYVRWLTDTGRLPAQRGPMGIRLIEKAAVETFARNRHKAREGTQKETSAK